MDDLIIWEISQEYIDHVAARKAEALASAKTYWYELREPEALVIVTYLTNVWLHAHEHSANAVPCSYPARSYDGMKMQLTIGQYDIELTYEFFVLDEEQDWFEPRWIANVTDTKTKDNLELFVQTEHSDVISYITSKKSEKCARELAEDIIHRCHNEFGVDFDAKHITQANIEYPVGMEVIYA